MSVDTAITRFREAQADQFTQTATVTRPTGDVEFDEDTGLETRPADVIATGEPCKTTAVEQIGTDRTVGHADVRFNDLMVKFRHDLDVQRNDIVTITDSVYNPADIGLTYRVTDIDRREWQIARRCIVEEITVPHVEEGS